MARTQEDGQVGSTGYRAPAVGRALAIIEFLADRGQSERLSTIARELTLPKSSCLALLSTLEREGYVRRDDDGDTWSLTLRVYYLGLQAASNVSIVPLAEPLLRRLRDKTNLTSHLALLQGRTVRYALKLPSSSFVQFDTTPGKPASLHLTAIARAILAHTPASDVNRLLHGYRFDGGTKQAIQSRRGFDAELVSVRRQGYALESGEETAGVSCIAAPVIDRGGGCIAAVGVTGLLAEMEDIEPIARRVIDTANELAEII